MGWQEPLADKSKAWGFASPFGFFGLTLFTKGLLFGSEKHLAFMLGLQDSTESMIKSANGLRTFIETDISSISPKA